MMRPSPYPALVSTVDPDDDSLHRYIVWHFRLDPERSQRRNVVVAAYDNETEMSARLSTEKAALDSRKSRGLAEEREWLHGSYRMPGYRETMVQQRQPWRRARSARVRKGKLE